MGCSPSFLAKNGQKCMFFAPFKLIENSFKVVKMTQNRSKPWAIVHASFSKMDKNACILHQQKYSKII
jgi:hypothetical protein